MTENDPVVFDNPPEDMFRTEADASWVRAREFASAIGHAPSLFSSCIRAINKVESVLDPIDHPSVRDLALSSSEFLIRVSPTLKAVFYNAANSLHPDALKALPRITPKSLLSPLSVREVATIIGLTYLYRRCQKRCEEQEWKILSRKIQAQMEIGAILGEKMSYVGIGNGILLGGIRYISIATFAIKEPKLYQAFKKRNRLEGKIFDIEHENEVFGCNHLQVASYLVQELGFCMPRSAVSMSLGMDAISADPVSLPPKLRTSLLSWQAAMAYIESFHGTGQPPETIDVEYALKLPQPELETLRQRIWTVVREGSTFDWMGKGKDDLPPEVAQQLGITPSVQRAGKKRTRGSGPEEERFDEDTFK